MRHRIARVLTVEPGDPAFAAVVGLCAYLMLTGTVWAVWVFAAVGAVEAHLDTREKRRDTRLEQEQETTA